MRFGKTLVVTGMLAGSLVPVGAPGVSDFLPGPIPARVLRVIDGDTIVVRARIWLGQGVETQVRLDGVDTPELRGKCERERRLARKARDFIVSHTAEGRVILRNIQYGKYAGRVVARVQTLDGEDFSMALLKAGLGKPYNGGHRGSWCDQPKPE